MLNDPQQLASIIESLLFVADGPLPLKRLQEVCDGVEKDLLLAALDLLRESYQQPMRGIELVEAAGGYQLRTVAANANWVLLLHQAKPQRLSRAALETLAIIAYKQPLTRPEVESIRGVDCGGVLKTLLEKDLVKILGKKEEPGNPLVYGTTETFLTFFGIKGLKELPSLKEYNDLREANETISLDEFAKVVEAGAVLDAPSEPETVPDPTEEITQANSLSPATES